MARAWRGSWSSIFESGAEGEAMIARLGQDPIARSLLLLYSLHPDDLETRVLKALDTVGPTSAQVRPQSWNWSSIHDGAVQLKLHTSRAHVAWLHREERARDRGRGCLRSGAGFGVADDSGLGRRGRCRLRSAGELAESSGTPMHAVGRLAGARSGRCQLRPCCALAERG